MATVSAPMLNADEALVGLIKACDSVELKLTVPEPAQLTTARALGLDPLQAQLRQVFFFETPDLSLDQVGLVVRARRSQKKGDDTVVKLRPVVPAELPAEIRNAPDFGVEVDAMPGGFVCSGSYKAALPDSPVRSAVLGERKLRKLFTKQQRAFYEAHAPAGLDIDDLSVLGPILVMKLKWVPEALGRKVVGEMWVYPDGSEIVELSTKCPPAEAFDTAVRTRAFLVDHGIDLAAPQQTKTRTALEFFTAELAANVARAGKATT
jgi:hypothetical protein